MNDPLKEFVERNREDFDHLDAPQLNLDLLKQRLATPVAEKKVIPFNALMSKWLVAASVLVVIATGILIFKAATPNTPILVSSKPSTTQKAYPKKVVETELNQHVVSLKKESRKVKKHQSVEADRVIAKPGLNTVYEQLSDSSSASNRLAVILNIDKNGLISESTINRLAKTLQYDGSSNVRLAALGVLEKYKDDSHVSNLLINALNNQKDPMVQLELVNLLGKMDNVKIDESLYALVSNPETFNAVKDEAYNILMKENKL